MNFYQHSPEQINQLADALEDPDLDMNGLGWKAAFHLRELQGRIFELEAQLYAIGAGGVGTSIQPPVQPDTAAPAQPPAAHQEPVAWIEHEWSGTGLRHLHFEKREPMVRDEVANPVWTPLYTAPPQRQPLTDEQMWADDGIMRANAGLGLLMKDIALLVRAVEAAHGITGGQQ